MPSSKRVDIVSVKLVKEASMLYKNRRIRSPQDCYELFKEFLGEVDREYFIVMCLDVKNQPTNITVAHIGSLNLSIVHPREVLKTAILTIICCHPHPSGDPTPSPEDVDVTKRLIEAGLIVGVEMLDHIVLGDDSYVSMKESGYFENE